MKVEIWSDIMCPFCYIGKRRFERALEQFPHSEQIRIAWKSFQLNPDMQTDPEASINEYLAKVKGCSLEQARQMNRHVTEMAADEGLQYNFDRAVVANSFRAHQLIQHAGTEGKSDQAEEALFRAYFTEGKNIDDFETLIETGSGLGFNASRLRELLENEAYAEAVNRDIEEARQMQIHGVPFFLFNRRYAVSGAQSSELFLNALNKSWPEWDGQRQPVELTAENSASCNTDGECG